MSAKKSQAKTPLVSIITATYNDEVYIENSKARPHGEEAVHPAIGDVVGIVFDSFAVIAAAFQYHHRRVGDDQGKDDVHDRAKGEQAAADGDKNHAEDDGADDALVEDAVAVAFGDFESGENGHHHEEVIDGKHFFQGVTELRDRKSVV